MIQFFPNTLSPLVGKALSWGHRAKNVLLAAAFPCLFNISTSSPENVDALMLLILKLKSLNIPEHLVHTKIPKGTHTERGACVRGFVSQSNPVHSTRESPPSERNARQERADSGVIDSMAHEVARVRRIARARATSYAKIHARPEFQFRKNLRSTHAPMNRDRRTRSTTCSRPRARAPSTLSRSYPACSRPRARGFRRRGRLCGSTRMRLTLLALAYYMFYSTIAGRPR